MFSRHWGGRCFSYSIDYGYSRCSVDSHNPCRKQGVYSVVDSLDTVRRFCCLYSLDYMENVDSFGGGGFKCIADSIANNLWKQPAGESLSSPVQQTPWRQGRFYSHVASGDGTRFSYQYR